MPKGMCVPIFSIIAQKMQKLKKKPNFGAKITQKCPKNTQNQKFIVYTSSICLKACVYQFLAL